MREDEKLHDQAFHLAGKTVTIKNGDLKGKEYRIEDYWDRLSGKSWGLCQGNPACLIYAMRIGLQEFRVPSDDEVLYGKIDGLGHLVHLKEIK